MDEKPKRRWFRFRLSTVLILTAIVAWYMASLPFYDPDADKVALIEGRRLNPSLLGPILAFFAFLAWKAAWAVKARFRNSQN